MPGLIFDHLSEYLKRNDVNFEQTDIWNQLTFEYLEEDILESEMLTRTCNLSYAKSHYEQYYVYFICA